GRRYEQEIITSRIQAQDLKWRFDAVRRLADAQPRSGPTPHPPGSLVDDDRRYVEPGVLWRAFNLELALTVGKRAAGSPPGVEPPANPAPGRGVVVLIDEIDKADPDVPNDLLVVLADRWFKVDDLDDQEVRAPEDLALFMVITTNGERDLPAAFVRRCVDYR